MTVGGKPAHIVSITDREIVAVAPEVEPGSTTVQAGRETATVRIAPESPGIFAKDSFGRGQARLRNEDGSMNSVENPAAKGSTVTLYVTGVRQPVIRIGGFPALVDRIERSAPGERAVRFTVPAGTEAGAAVPITIESGAHPGQQGVTIAVRD